MKPLICRRFNCKVWLTHHAEMMLLERNVSEAELIELVETGDIKRKSEIHWWFYKNFLGRSDNLVCAAVQKGNALIVKTVMIDWRLEE
ncbi:MAG: DUF4258 domain-containing protein [Candidatus Contendobacter sp.]